MNDLKSCPFCGGKGRIEVKDRTDWREDYQVGFVVCERCGCRTIGVETAPGWKKIVTETWNRRADHEAEYKICFRVAGAFGAQISFEAKPGVSYEDAAAALDKDKLAKLICLDTLGYSAKDIEIITPEQYEAEFGGDEDG